MKWKVGTSPPPLEGHDVHVWRVGLSGGPGRAVDHASVLAEAELARMARFVTQDLRDRFALAHGALRRILAAYTGDSPESLVFAETDRGKPSLADGDVAFNLSHSGDIALVAVTRAPSVGVDVEQWKNEVEHHGVAEYCFSPNEQRALREVGSDPHATAQGFFAAWSRKEAYIKATGAGVTDGLDHFDVALAPGTPAALLIDRRDARAHTRWVMRNLDVAPGYSAALVVEAPLGLLAQLDFSAPWFRA